MTVVLLSTK